MNLFGKKILVTGGAKRIGRAICEHLAQLGAKVLIHYHTSERESRELADRLGAKRFQADLTCWEEVKRFVEDLKREELDGLVHSASIFYPTTSWEEVEAHWEAYFTLHVKVPYYLVFQLFHKRSGRVVFLSDVYTERPRKGFGPYVVSKAALNGLAKFLAVELAPEVRVNLLSLGAILPPSSGEIPPKGRGLLPLPETPQVVAEAVAFLLSSDYMTGSCLRLDGGRWLKE